MVNSSSYLCSVHFPSGEPFLQPTERDGRTTISDVHACVWCLCAGRSRPRLVWTRAWWTTSKRLQDDVTQGPCRSFGDLSARFCKDPHTNPLGGAGVLLGTLTGARAPLRFFFDYLKSSRVKPDHFLRFSGSVPPPGHGSRESGEMVRFYR